MAVSPLLIAVPLVLFMAGSGKKRRKGPSGTVTLGEPDVEHDEHEEPEPDETEPYDPPTDEPVPGPGPSGWPVYTWGDGPKAAPIVVGDQFDPEVAAQLIQMEGDFASLGVDLSKVSAYEVTRMRKAPGKPAAIPPREYWPRMAQTLREAFMPLRQEIGKPLAIYNGYRPADYNEAVGGAAGSRHQWFEGLDLDVEGSKTADRKKLAALAAQLYLALGDDLEMGFGVYGNNPEYPTNIHIDTGHRKRTWGNARHWIDKVANGYAGRRAMAGRVRGANRKVYPARTWQTIAGGGYDPCDPCSPENEIWTREKMERCGWSSADLHRCVYGTDQHPMDPGHPRWQRDGAQYPDPSTVYPSRPMAGHPGLLLGALHASAHAAAVVPPVSRYGPSQARVQSRPGGLHSGGPGQRRAA